MAGGGLSRGRRLLYALLTLALFAAGLEAALRLSGAGARRLSLSRGFSPDASYIVPHPDRPGWWRTQMNGAEAPEIEVPPRGAALRVLMFGGSNVAGFQTGQLQRALCEQLPDPGFEVVNLGRSGYGSERELILLRQALVLQPDIVLIYVGHNEFVEGGFALELSRKWEEPAVMRLVDGLLSVRSVRAGVELLRGADDTTPLPEARRPRRKVFDDMTPERADVFHDVYRSNLAAMIDACRAAGARVLLATVVSNLFDPPYVTNPPGDWDAARRAALEQARARQLALVPERLRLGLVPEGPGLLAAHPRPSDWGERIADAERDARAAAGATRVAPAGRPYSGPLADAPYWSEPVLWSERTAGVVETFGQVCARELSPGERDALQRALLAGDEALALCADDPLTLFTQGLCTFLLGEDDARAAELLRAAAAADRAPTKGTDRTNAIVRELAAARAADAGLLFVDMDEVFRARCPQGLPGFEIMQDSCHLHPGARLVLVEDFVPALVELGHAAVQER